MSPAGSSENYYEVLGVHSTASSAEIKRAYRHKVRATHPDLSQGAPDPALFRQVQRAYEVLSNPIDRTRYDMVMGLGAYAGHVRFYRRSFERLFDSLFGKLRTAMNSTAELSDLVEAEQPPPTATRLKQTRRKAG